MSIKAVFFDVDGVLFSSKDIHYKALNKALAKVSTSYCIPYDDHIQKYDGLPTKKKLEILAASYGLPYSYFSSVNKDKQDFTREMLRCEVHKDQSKIELFEKLHKDGLKTAIASNAILDTVLYILYGLGLTKDLCGPANPHFIIANDELKSPKPHPEIYLKCMVKSGFCPDECLVIEDSPKGVEAAKRSGAHVMVVKSPCEVTYENVRKKIDEINNKIPTISSKIWTQDNLNIVIPMAGEGSRFKERFTFPKPLVDVLGKPLIAWAIESLKCEANYIFLVRKEHLQQYNIESMLNILTKGKYKIVPIEGLTEGAACTVLKAKELINNTNPLVISNCDQYYEANMAEFYYKNSVRDIGSILTFPSTHPKWSYIEKSFSGYVNRVAEKEVISNEATVGVYAFHQGSDFVEAAEEMIRKNKRVKGEFYVAPAINESISLRGRLFTSYPVKKMMGLGTVEDVDFFLNNYGWRNSDE